MPYLIDLPLGELQAYQGRNPKPVDFDAFWARGLQEMRSVEPKVELIPADFRCSFADCFDLYFTGTGGARVHAKLLKPRILKSKAPALLHFHGYSDCSSAWTSYLPYVAEGFILAALDCRGQGGKSEDKGGVRGGTLHGHIVRGLAGPADNLYYRHVFLDTALLARIVSGMVEVDGTRMGAFGGSQGGGLTLACAALAPEIRLAAPQFPFLCDYQRVWEMDLAKDAYLELREHFRKHDPLHVSETEVFSKLGYIDCQHLAGWIRAEVQMTTGMMDTICPPSSQYAAYNKIISPKNLIIYPDFGHEGLPGEPDRTFEFLVQLKG